MKSLVLYLLISILVTLFDIIFLVILIELFHLYYLFAVTISFISAVLLKFSLNKTIIFYYLKDQWRNQLLRFFMVSITCLMITNIIMFIGVSILLINYLPMKMVAIVVVLFFTFTFHNLFSFKSITLQELITKKSKNENSTRQNQVE